MANLKTQFRCLTSGHLWRDSHSQPGYRRCLRCQRLQRAYRKADGQGDAPNG